MSSAPLPFQAAAEETSPEAASKDVIFSRNAALTMAVDWDNIAKDENIPTNTRLIALLHRMNIFIRMGDTGQAHIEYDRMREISLLNPLTHLAGTQMMLTNGNQEAAEAQFQHVSPLPEDGIALKMYVVLSDALEKQVPEATRQKAEFQDKFDEDDDEGGTPVLDPRNNGPDDQPPLAMAKPIPGSPEDGPKG